MFSIGLVYGNSVFYLEQMVDSLLYHHSLLILQTNIISELFLVAA